MSLTHERAIVSSQRPEAWSWDPDISSSTASAVSVSNEPAVETRSPSSENHLPKEAEPTSAAAGNEENASESGTGGSETNQDAEPQPIRSRPLLFLTILALLYSLYFARAILLPVSLAIVLSLLLRPIVRWLSRRKLPESVGAALCLITLLFVFGFGFFRLIGPAQQWVAEFPQRMQQAESKLRVLKSRFTKISEAKAKIEEIAAGDDHSKPLEVQVQQPSLANNVVLLSTTGSMLASVGLVLVLTYFLLTSGDQLINNILTTMPTFREKRQIVELILNVQKGVSSYLFAVTMINICLGIAVAFAMWLIGLPNPGLWGFMVTLLNFIPYVGALTCGLMISFVALLTFDSIAYASVAPIVFFAITTIEGQLITPAILGRQMSLNPIMVFLFFTFWGWMWGVGGALLAVPILAITKITCDQFERTRPLGTMLSG